MEGPNITVQAWVDIRDVATAVLALEAAGVQVSGNRSAIVKACIMAVAKQYQALRPKSVNNACEILASKGFPMGQFAKGRGIREAIMVEEDIIADRPKQTAEFEKRASEISSLLEE